MRNTLQLASLFLTALLTVAPGATQTGINLNHSTPAAPTGTRNVTFQNDASAPTRNVSAYVTYPTVQVACPSGSDLSTAVNACLASLPTPTGGICDARACSANFTWNSATTFSGPNQALLLPCGVLTVTTTVTISPTVRNSTIHGCAYQGGSASSGTAGGSVWNYQGNGTAFIIGDTGDGSDTPGFYLTDLTLATANGGSSAHAIDFHRVQEIDIERVYLIGNNSTGQTGITLDGTGNYSGGTFQSFRLSNFGTALKMTGDGTGAANASTFTRMHLNCSTSGGSPISGVIGVNLAYGDGNTFVGGDIEGCDTMLYLGAGAKNNTFTGVRNENSNTQITAASGSSYNLWITGGTMFTGKLTDAGTHNSFADSFHRSWNNLNGDLWRSQSDATITNHIYTGIGLGHVRGRLQEWQTDVPGSPGNYQLAWQWGPGDGTAGSQLWQLNDMLSNVVRIGVLQTTTGSGNDQTYLNATGTAAVCVNCSTNSGTGGFNIASGGAAPSTVWGATSAGNITQNGFLRFWASGAEQWRLNCASTSSCAIDSWATGSAVHHIRLYPGSGTELDSEGTAGISINNTDSGGTGPFTVYGGGATYYNTKLFQVQNNNNGTANYLLPSLAAASGHLCVQVDTSGYLSTYNGCGSGSGGSGTVTSVGLSLPAVFTVSYSPVVSSGTLTATWNNQTAHYFLAGPAYGSDTTPAFRTIVAADVPTLNQSTSGNAATATAADHSPTQCSTGQYSTGDTTAWAANCAQVQYSQLGGSVPTWNQSTTGNAATATALAAAPSTCSTGYAPTGISANGNATGCAAFGSGSGSVTSVGLSLPAQFNVANSPVTNSGTLNASWASQAGHSFLAGLDSSSTGTPTFRAIAADDVPTLNQSTSGNAATATALAAAPSTCSAGYAPTGVTASGAATGCAPIGTALWATNGATYLSTTATQYIGVNYIESGSRTQPWVAPRAGTVQNCTATANVAESGSNYYTLSLYKNGSYCSGPQIVLNGAQYTAVSDNSHTCAIAQGDLLSWQSAVTGTPTAALVTITCSF